MKRRLALLLAMLLIGLGAAYAESAAMDVPEDVPYLRTVRIRAAAEVMVHSTQLNLAKRSDGGYDFHDQFSLVNGALSGADYTIATLETTIGKVGNQDYSGYQLFNSPESLLDAIRDAGVDYLALAHEHILDRGLDGLYQTVERVESRGFQHGGANRSRAEKETPVVVEINSVKFALICYTQGTNGMEKNCPRDAVTFGVNYLTIENVRADVARAKEAGAEAIIAVVHWGEAYKDAPGDEIVSLAKKMVGAGVDVLIGCHSHRLQPIKYVTGRGEDGVERTGLVAYSLGNFINNLSVDGTDTGVVLDFTLREKQDGGFEAVNVRLVPIFCWRHEDKKILRAVPSQKYRERSPSGMDSTRKGRMHASLSAVERAYSRDYALMSE